MTKETKHSIKTPLSEGPQGSGATQAIRGENAVDGAEAILGADATEERRRERTLLVAFLLSAWGPFTTGLAVVLSRSTTQLADFVRRTTDLVALFMSWWLFRYMRRHPQLPESRKLQLERRATSAVAGALLVTSAAMIVLFVSRLSDFTPGGNVWLGLGIAVAGGGVNGWFWLRYSRFLADRHDAIVHNQVRLYRAKTIVDVVVVTVLAAVAWQPTHPVTRIVDLGGSLIVAFYLAVSGIRSIQDARKLRPLPDNSPSR